MDNKISIQKDLFTQDPSTVKFTFLDNGDHQSGFIIFFNANYYAYRNKCQHLDVELDWDNNEFFEEDEKLIVCSTHGALYEPSTGKCVLGPCAGASLESLRLKVIDERLIITI